MILSRCGEGGARVNVYIVNVEIKATQSGYKACMNFEDNKGQLHEKQLAQEQKASMQSNYLAGFIAVLTALQNPCMLSIYSHSDYIVEPVRQGWLQSWAQHERKNAKGKTVRNAEQWQQVKKLLAGHSVRFINNKEDK